MARRQRRSGGRRSITPWLIVALVVVTAVVAYYIFTTAPANQVNTSISTPVSTQIMGYLTGVSDSTLNTVGLGPSTVSSPTSISAATTPLTSNGKPEVLYVGGEYCPYCAVERWAMLVALSRFGNFSGVQYMLSSGTDTPPSVPTFTFAKATYTSNYITFVAVEQYDRNNNPYQSVSTDQQTLMKTYDSGGSIPFIDFGNKYIQTGSQFSPPMPVTGNWSALAPLLNTPSSPVAGNVDGAANRMISIICKLTSNQPAKVCSQTYAQVVSYVKLPSGMGQLALSEVARATIGLEAIAPLRTIPRA